MKKASEYMSQEGFNCSMGVLCSIAGEFGLSEENAKALAAGFGGGIGQKGLICGCVTASYMAIGLAHRYDDQEEIKHNVYKDMRLFDERFLSENPSLNCKDIIGFDISDGEAARKGRERGVFKHICPPLADSCAEIVRDVTGLK